MAERRAGGGKRISKARIALPVAFLLLLWCGLIGRTAYLHLGPNTRLRERVETLRTMSTTIKASRGRITDRNGQFVQYETGPVIWGEPGTPHHTKIPVESTQALSPAFFRMNP